MLDPSTAWRKFTAGSAITDYPSMETSQGSSPRSLLFYFFYTTESVYCICTSTSTSLFLYSMNASAYLKGHGWRGDGFSLDASDRGLAKPLLVSHKLDLAGLGTKKNDFSNQWWLTSFDKSLQAIGNKVSPVSDLSAFRGSSLGLLRTCAD